jgi:hypothetical protein
MSVPLLAISARWFIVIANSAPQSPAMTKLANAIYGAPAVSVL